MDSQPASEKVGGSKLNFKRNQDLLVVKSTYIKLIGSLIFMPVCHVASLDVKAQLREDVLLPCTVKYKDEFDYNMLVVHWQRPGNDIVVHTFFYGSSQPDYQADHYRSRTEMFYDLLPFGNLSLLLKNLSESDAGIYSCHSILKESSGFVTKYVNLTVEGRSEDQIEQHNYHILAWICLTSLAFILVFFFLYYKWKVKRNKKHDEENEVLLPISQESLIQDYKKHLTSSSRPQYDSVLQRQLLVIEPGFLGSCKIMKTSIGNNSEEINAEELFTLENQHLLSRRMLLVGDAGSGKSYFCKWLQHKWIQKDINIYNCILYLSCKNIKNEMSLKKICDTIFEQISTVLSMDKILLIFDELDDLLCQKENVNLTEKIDTDTPLDIKTLLKLIMGKQLVPDTDVLIASRSDSWIFSNNKFDSTFYLLDFTEEETKNLYNTITAKDKKADNRSKRISDITYTPAFVVLMSYLQTAKELENNRDCSPYKILIDVLLMWTTDVTGKRRDLKNNFTNMAKKAYENLTKGEPYSSESMEYWEEFLKLYNCEHKYIYQCNMLRDMLAAMHCVWETHRIGGLTECLDFWVFGNIIYSNNNELLKSIADEHNAKYYHFIRFFLRLLTYPDCDSLCNNKPVKNRDTQELLSGWFKKSFNIHSKHSERLKIIHCIFELNNEKVTREFWSIIKKIELFNTPLNFLGHPSHRVLLERNRIGRAGLEALCS
ncbi:uncharacterized protein [Engystomops pustulosus]